MRLGIGLVVVVAAIVILVGFVAFDWIDGYTALDLQQSKTIALTVNSITWDDAGQTWITANGLGEDYSLDAALKPTRDSLGTAALEIQNDRGKNVFTTATLDRGPNDTRRVDRLLLLVPLGAIILGLLALSYTFGWIAPEPALLGMVIIAFVLLALPFLWEQASTANWHAAVENQSDSKQFNQANVQIVEDFGAEVYATTLHKVFAALAVMFSLGGLIVPSERFQTTVSTMFYNQKQTA